MVEKLSAKSPTYYYQERLMFLFTSYLLAKNQVLTLPSKASSEFWLRYKKLSTTCFRKNKTKQGLIIINSLKLTNQFIFQSLHN